MALDRVEVLIFTFHTSVLFEFITMKIYCFTIKKKLFNKLKKGLWFTLVCFHFIPSKCALLYICYFYFFFFELLETFEIESFQWLQGCTLVFPAACMWNVCRSQLPRLFIDPTLNSGIIILLLNSTCCWYINCFIDYF